MNEQIYRRKHGKQSERQLYGNLGCIGLKATISSGKAKTNHLTKQGETIGTNQQGKKLQKQKPKTSAKHEGTCLVVSLFILFAFVLFSEYWARTSARRSCDSKTGAYVEQNYGNHWQKSSWLNVPQQMLTPGERPSPQLLQPRFSHVASFPGMERFGTKKMAQIVYSFKKTTYAEHSKHMF